VFGSLRRRRARSVAFRLLNGAPLATTAVALPPPHRPTVVAHEKELIEAALAKSNGRIAGPSGAAAKRGIPGQTLESKIRSFGIDKYRFRTA
jgi:transcriptional regulator with GAF, ATPase, and Fis domain